MGGGWLKTKLFLSIEITILEATNDMHTVNDLLNARGVYLIFVLKGGGRLIDTRRLLEGGVYFLSKVTHSNHYRNKLTALLNSNNFYTTFAEACKNKTLSVMEKKSFLRFM